ncbi:MAG: helix-turn-helix transcriptional regulator [Clostridia bacterium]|nr:helix-turn-helix transcriptional regulator [Clostridia bacterium]
MDAKKIGVTLRELRGHRSRYEVAKAIGVSVSAISMYEIGERIPKDSVKTAYAKLFGKSVEEIFFS